MRSVLICHDDAPLDRHGLARWLGSFSDLAGIVVIQEKKSAVRKRVLRQFKRVGPIRFLDVLAFRLHYRLCCAKTDAAWEENELSRLQKHYPESNPEVLHSTTPNSKAVAAFMRKLAPDIVVARSKFMIRKRIFEIPSKGTFVLHPGICPQYRNSHGCFWALCNRDLDNVGVTLLKIDEGIDTGPVFGIYKCPFDETAESHHRIQLRALFENLDEIQEKLIEIGQGRAIPLDREGRPSATWGQPWLSKYLKWKRNAGTPGQP